MRLVGRKLWVTYRLTYTLPVLNFHSVGAKLRLCKGIKRPFEGLLKAKIKGKKAVKIRKPLIYNDLG